MCASCPWLVRRRDADGLSRIDYYSRYRPGLIAVLLSLAAFTCAVQYLFFWLQYKVGEQKVTESVPSPRTDEKTVLIFACASD